MSKRRFDLAPVCVLAFVIRLAWVWFGAWVAGDSAWYLSVARNIAFHHVFSAGAEGGALAPTAFRPPLYSAVIALLWFGDSAPIQAVLLLQVVLGTATVALVYLLARDQFGRGVALLAGTGMALAPMTGYFTAVILTETLFTFLLTLGVFWLGTEPLRCHRSAFRLGNAYSGDSIAFRCSAAAAHPDRTMAFIPARLFNDHPAGPGRRLHLDGSQRSRLSPVYSGSGGRLWH